MLKQVTVDAIPKRNKTVSLDGKYNVIFKMQNDYFFEGEFICETISFGYCYPSSQLTLRLGRKILQKRATDYFDALCHIREDLEKQNIYPCCFGACENVYPSGLVRGMYNGLKAYKLEFGQPAKTLVNIFEHDKNFEPTTVADQKKFYQDYCNSFSW